MYLDFFGISESPFPTVAVSENYFGFQSMQHSLDALKAAIEREAGPCLVIGAAGTGKSILLAVLQAQQQNQKTSICLSGTRLCTRRSLLQSLMYELGLDYQTKDEGELRLQLNQYLRQSDRCSHGLLLLVDEAHTLPQHLLDELRILTNVIRNNHPVVQLVLAGSASLEEVLAEPAMESFQQRIGCRVYLGSMGREELQNYVDFQLERVQSSYRNIFTSEAIRSIHIATQGIPRLVNQLCEFALVCAAEKRTRQIDEDLIQWAWSTMQQIPCAPAPVAVSAGKVNAGSSPSTDIIEFGELDDEPAPMSNTASANPVDAKVNAGPAFDHATKEDERAETFPMPTYAADDSGSVHSKAPAVITFAFEQDIQKPIGHLENPNTQVDAAREAQAEAIVQQAREALMNDDQSIDQDELDSIFDTPGKPDIAGRPLPVKQTKQPAVPVRTEVDLPRMEKHFQNSLETISHALDSLDDDWLVVEQVLAEAELNQLVRPVCSDPEKTFPAVAGKKPSGLKVPVVDPGQLFGDRYFSEIESIQDVQWGRFLQPLDATPVPASQAVKVVEQEIDVPAVTLSAVDSQDSPSANEVSEEVESLSMQTDDDRRIIRPVANEEIARQHGGHSQIGPPAARRKDLRALLTALRGY